MTIRYSHSATSTDVKTGLDNVIAGETARGAAIGSAAILIARHCLNGRDNYRNAEYCADFVNKRDIFEQPKGKKKTGIVGEEVARWIEELTDDPQRKGAYFDTIKKRDAAKERKGKIKGESADATIRRTQAEQIVKGLNDKVRAATQLMTNAIHVAHEIIRANGTTDWRMEEKNDDGTIGVEGVVLSLDKLSVNANGQILMKLPQRKDGKLADYEVMKITNLINASRLDGEQRIEALHGKRGTRDDSPLSVGKAFAKGKPNAARSMVFHGQVQSDVTSHALKETLGRDGMTIDALHRYDDKAPDHCKGDTVANLSVVTVRFIELLGKAGDTQALNTIGEALAAALSSAESSNTGTKKSKAA